MRTERPSIKAAVVMEREARPNRWEEWRFALADVVVDEGGFGSTPRVLRDDGTRRQTLYPGFELALFADEGEGYHLNLTSGAPVWFVMWRIDDTDPSQARPEALSLSYNEAGRWLDAQERVDNVPLPTLLRAWLQAYTDAHYQPQPKQRKRPASFVPPDQR
jgi:hypothetical protein